VSSKIDFLNLLTMTAGRMGVLLGSLYQNKAPEWSVLVDCVNIIGTKFCQDQKLIFGKPQDAVEFFTWVVNTYFEHVLISGPFQIHKKTTSYCKECRKNVSVARINHMSYGIDIDLTFLMLNEYKFPKDRPVTLETCLSSTFSFTDSGDGHLCRECNKAGVCKIKTEVMGTLPPFLILTLKRATRLKNRTVKVPHLITYKAVMELACQNGEPTETYHLHTVQRHTGCSADDGHYFIETVDEKDIWWEINDGSPLGEHTEGTKLDGPPQDRHQGTEVMLIYQKKTLPLDGYPTMSRKTPKKSPVAASTRNYTTPLQGMYENPIMMLSICNILPILIGIKQRSDKVGKMRPSELDFSVNSDDNVSERAMTPSRKTENVVCR
jgi:hypothetical protein